MEEVKEEMKEEPKKVTEPKVARPEINFDLDGIINKLWAIRSRPPNTKV